MAALEVVYEDTPYILDVEDMDTDDARVMERCGIKNLVAMQNGIGEGDVQVLTFLFWLMLKQSGEPIRLDKVKFKPAKFLNAIGTAGEKAVEAAEEAELGKEA